MTATARGVLYVGTEDGLAIYRADTSAWQRVGHTLAGHAIRAIIAADAQTLLVAADSGMAQQSFDGGMTWSAAGGPAPEPIGLQVATEYGPAPLAYPRLSGATAYARLAGRPAVLLGAGADGSMLFRSEDDGIHWKPARMDTGAVGRIGAMIPASDTRTAAWAGSALGYLLRTGDAGQTWHMVAQEPAAVLSLAAVPEG